MCYDNCRVITRQESPARPNASPAGGVPRELLLPCAWAASSWASSFASSPRVIDPTGFSWHRTQPFRALSSAAPLPSCSQPVTASGRDPWNPGRLAVQPWSFSGGIVVGFACTGGRFGLEYAPNRVRRVPHFSLHLTPLPLPLLCRPAPPAFGGRQRAPCPLPGDEYRTGQRRPREYFPLQLTSNPPPMRDGPHESTPRRFFWRPVTPDSLPS